MKTHVRFISLFIFALTALNFQSCEELTDTDSPSGTFDSQIVGVWIDAARRDGLEIKSDGTFQILTLDTQNKIVYNTDEGFISGKFTKASGGVFETEEKYNDDGEIQTFVAKGKYLVSNGGANLTVTVESVNGETYNEVYTMVKKSMGEIVTGGTTGGGLSVTMESQTYTFTNVSAYQDSNTINIAASGTTMSNFAMYTLRTVGVHTADGNSTGIWLILNSTTYTSDTGTVTVTVVDGKNTQGTFTVTMQEQFNSTNKKDITGTFNVTLP